MKVTIFEIIFNYDTCLLFLCLSIYYNPKHLLNTGPVFRAVFD